MSEPGGQVNGRGRGGPLSYAVVVPSVGRRSLQVLIDSLGDGTGPLPDRVVVVDDRPEPDGPLDVLVPGRLERRLRVVRSGGHGPAAARNLGWRTTGSTWVVFVDDDVLLPGDWPLRLDADLSGLGADLGGSQARVRVPLSGDRRPTDAGASALGGAATGHPLPAVGGAAAWLGLTGRFAWLPIAPGPRTRVEVGTMLATSVAIPPVATYHWLRGRWLHRRVPRWQRPPRVVLFDRDGTLVHDVPYNGDPALVRPVHGARAALDRLRGRGIRLGVVSNQSGIGRRVLAPSDVDAVNARVAELLGPFDTWAVCPHVAGDGCGCRKPAPGLVRRALADVGLPAAECAVVGDIGSDVAAALAAGARAVLVPTGTTRPAEVRAAPEVARDLGAAVDLLLGEVPR